MLWVQDWPPATAQIILPYALSGRKKGTRVPVNPPLHCHKHLFFFLPLKFMPYLPTSHCSLGSNGAYPRAYVLHYLQKCTPNTPCTCLLAWRRPLPPQCHFQLLLTHCHSWRCGSEACSCSSKYSSWSTSKQSLALETSFSKELLISSSLAFCCLACLRQLYTASNASTPSFPMAHLGTNIMEKVK